MVIVSTELIFEINSLFSGGGGGRCCHFRIFNRFLSSVPPYTSKPFESTGCCSVESTVNITYLSTMTEDRPKKRKIPGLADEDYYMTREGFVVFTANYHLKRGYCCKSGCRHCPYGYRKEK
ncbi:DUF5522 domain-containing protein [Fibrivirga algicola]|uniref:DUF5522 domain-containing protein n=1 Tax=Fibrivirga algicola TaxID=2950420 RepID=UPI00286E762C|nr:DUF5522 domain-containing protein [Fibrivirga algicola]